MKRFKYLILFSLLFTVACSSKSINRNVREISLTTTDSSENYAIQDVKQEKKRLEDIIVFNEKGVTIKRDGNNLILSMPELILFDFDKYEVKNAIKPSLKILAKALQDNPDILIKIDGYTDFIGSDSYNLDLSVKRANAIKKYLVSNGAISNNISIEGYGKQNPIANNKTESGRARNRRVEFIISR